MVTINAVLFYTKSDASTSQEPQQLYPGSWQSSEYTSIHSLHSHRKIACRCQSEYVVAA